MVSQLRAERLVKGGEIPTEPNRPANPNHDRLRADNPTGSGGSSRSSSGGGRLEWVASLISPEHSQSPTGRGSGGSADDDGRRRLGSGGKGARGQRFSQRRSVGSDEGGGAGEGGISALMSGIVAAAREPSAAVTAALMSGLVPTYSTRRSKSSAAAALLAPPPHAGAVTAITFLPGGRAVTAGGGGKAGLALMVWDSAAYEQLGSTTRRATQWLRSPVTCMSLVTWGRVVRGAAGGVETHVITGHDSGQVGD